MTKPWFLSVVCASFYAPLILNAIIDVRTQRLIKRWTHVAAIWAFIALPLSIEPNALAPTLIVVVTMSAPWVLVSALSHGRWLGMGDARLLVVLGLWHVPHGIDQFITMVIIAVCGQGIVALVFLVRKRATMSSTFPFGPWLVAASLAVAMSQ